MTVYDIALEDGADRVPIGHTGGSFQKGLTVSPRSTLEPVQPHTAPRAIATAPSGFSPLSRGFCMVAPLMLSDGVALAIATGVAFCGLRLFGPLPISGIHAIMPALAAATLVAYLAFEQYAVIGINPVVEFRQLTKVNTLVFIIFTIGTYLVSAGVYWRFFFAIEWGIALLLTPVFRSLVRAWCARQSWWGQPVLLFGSNEAVAGIARTLEKRPSSGLRPVAFVTVDDQNPPDTKHNGSAASTSNCKRIALATAAVLVREQSICFGIVASPDPARRAALVNAATALSLPSVLLMNPEQVLPSLWCDARDFAGLHATEVRNRLLLPFPRSIKRAVDLTLTTIGGLIILPLFASLALAVKLSGRGPIFFGQTRIGQNGRKFTAWKFRTMRTDAAEVLQHYLDAHPELLEEWNKDHKLKNDPRVTSIGRILRKTSLDELPQLWNVLRGEMSLVGPRPIVEAEVAKYGEIYRQYLLVRPGITGIWQVSGRNNTTYQERIELDRYYVQNWSPWLDFHLLIRTAKTVFNRSGAY